MAMSITVSPWYVTMQRPELLNSPITVALFPRLVTSRKISGHFSGGTAKVIRSCDSEIQICQGASPGYLSGTFSNCTTQPLLSLPISATEHDNPPAPLSVMLRYNPRSRASLTRTSLIFFWVIGSPICTAVAGLPVDSASEENVAP